MPGIDRGTDVPNVAPDALRPESPPFLGPPGGFAARRGVGCGESVGILKIAAGACVMR
jgi:hypothetical protein